MAEAFLYVIGEGRDRHKVGLSTSPRRRLSQLQTGTARRLILKRASAERYADAAKIESYAHWLLRESAIRGEWFKVTEEAAWVALTAAVQAVSQGLEVPAPPRPEPRKRGRPLHDHEPVLIRFVPGTREEIKAVLAEGEDNASFVRLAVSKEIARRKRSSAKPTS